MVSIEIGKVCYGEVNGDLVICRGVELVAG
jgi:hypothetical protein